MASDFLLSTMGSEALFSVVVTMISDNVVSEVGTYHK